MVNKNIEKLLFSYLNLPLECDGMTRVISYILTNEGIEHTVCIGNLSFEYSSIIHYWIELPNGYIIDYCSKMWYPKVLDVQVGIFKYQDTPLVYEKYQEGFDKPISEFDFRILTICHGKNETILV